MWSVVLVWTLLWTDEWRAGQLEALVESGEKWSMSFVPTCNNAINTGIHYTHYTTRTNALSVTVSRGSQRRQVPAHARVVAAGCHALTMAPPPSAQRALERRHRWCAGSTSLRREQNRS